MPDMPENSDRNPTQNRGLAPRFISFLFDLEMKNDCQRIMTERSIRRFASDIENEIELKGYHILNRNRAHKDYPLDFSQFGNIDQIIVGNTYTIRLFVKIGNIGLKVESGFADIKIIMKLDDIYTGRIETQLPAEFPVKKGHSLKLRKEEILYGQKRAS